MTPAVDKMDGRDHINTSHHECQSKLMRYLATGGLLESRSASFIKVSEQVRSDVFKGRPAFSFTVIILA